MIQSITDESRIFGDENYLKDVIPFSLIETIKKNPLILQSDEENFIIAASATYHPAWIWTKDGISASKLEELLARLQGIVQNFPQFLYIAKDDIAINIENYFSKHGFKPDKKTFMESFECQNLIPPKNTTVKIEKPVAEDIIEVAIALRRNEFEIFGVDAKINVFLPIAAEEIMNQYFFVIKEDGVIAAMATGKFEDENHVAISKVYTKEEYRNRGYAGALVAHISKMIQDKGKTPILYTDKSNPYSNRAYINVGFQPRGSVTRVEMVSDNDRNKG